VFDPPAPPTGGASSDIYAPRPGVYWAWVQPSFAAFGACSGSALRLNPQPNPNSNQQDAGASAPPASAASSVPAVAAASSSGGGDGGTQRGGAQRTPNAVYVTEGATLAQALAVQTPRGAALVAPAGEPQAAAAAARGAAGFEVAAAAAAKSVASGSLGPAPGCSYSPSISGGGTVTAAATLAAAVARSGVITHGSAAGQLDYPLGLAYPQVAVRGGTMLVTYTYSSYANLQGNIPGVITANVPAFAGWRVGLGGGAPTGRQGGGPQASCWLQ
jgi:hypothetical protein